jgi:hypothetical protein
MSEEFNVDVLSKALIGIKVRAERLNDETITETFASVGPLVEVISNEDHQVIYGRRGTGKTHALRFLSSKVASEGGVSFFSDLTNLGSDISIYNNESLPLPERATRLLIDVLNSISNSVIEFATSPESNLSNSDIGRLMKILDQFNDSVSQVRVEGETSISLETEKSKEKGGFFKTSISKSPSVSAGTNHKEDLKSREVQQVTGKEIPNPRFPNLSSSLLSLIRFFDGKRVWILLDEWSSVPLDVQPFLADMLRRVFFSIQNVTVKIAAIEHRTRFLIHRDTGDYIGFEPTADIKTNLKLDDYLLFGNDRERPVNFFSEFLFKHVLGVCREKGWPEPGFVAQIS